MEIAKEKQLDLLLIAPNANPPVARIVNFNKYLYDENRKERANKSKIKKTEIKELRMTPMTSNGDIVRLSKRAVQFMEDGNKVKVSVKMKGRQMAHPEVAREKINRMIEELSDKAKTEGEPKLVGSLLWVVFLSK